MKIKTTFALAIAALVVTVPPAAADPDTFPPQPRSSGQPDVVDRYVADATRSRGSDAVDRHLGNQADGAATHLDSPGVRAGAYASQGGDSTAGGGGRSWTTDALVVLGGGLVILIALAGGFAAHERRRPVLR